jgi:hypothetical protein
VNLSKKFPELPAERKVRFGCGFIAGAVLGFAWMLFELAPESRTTLYLGTLVIAVGFGVFAAVLGNRFWKEL